MTKYLTFSSHTALLLKALLHVDTFTPPFCRRLSSFRFELLVIVGVFWPHSQKSQLECEESSCRLTVCGCNWRRKTNEGKNGRFSELTDFIRARDSAHAPCFLTPLASSQWEIATFTPISNAQASNPLVTPAGGCVTVQVFLGGSESGEDLRLTERF